MNKRAIASCFAGFMFCTNAVASLQPGWVGNWYMGISAGYADLYGEFNSSLAYNGAVAPLAPDTPIVRNFADTGLIVSALGGYQEINHQWLVGAEVNFDLQSIDDDHHYAFSDNQGLVGWTANGRFQRRRMIGLTGRVGYAITTIFMPYVRLGMEISDDKYRASFVGNPSVLPVEIVINEKHWVHRFLTGFGVEIPIPDTCGGTMRLEYNIHSKERTIQGSGSVIDGVFSPTITSGGQPKMHSARLSLVWNFF